MRTKQVVTVGLPHDPKVPKYTEVYSHRGAIGFSPENTMPSLKTGLACGTDWIDVDIGITSDGVIVVSHDLWLSPDIISRHGEFWAPSKEVFTTVNAANLSDAVQPYIIHNMTLKEFKGFEAGIINPNSPYAQLFPDQIAVPGTSMPTLQEVIDFGKAATQNKIHYQIEIKNDPTQPLWTVSPKEFASALYKMLKNNHLLDRVEIQAFDWNCLYELQQLDKRIKTAYLVGYDDRVRMCNPDPVIAGVWSRGKLLKDYNNSLPQMIKALGGSCFEPEDVTLTKEELDEAHQLGLKVVVWAWPDHTGVAFNPDEINKPLDWGVDGIITSDPGRLISMMAARGMRVPSSYR